MKKFILEIGQAYFKHLSRIITFINLKSLHLYQPFNISILKVIKISSFLILLDSTSNLKLLKFLNTRIIESPFSRLWLDYGVGVNTNDYLRSP